MNIESKTLGILPCAGTASRLFHLPKFMLPCKDESQSLLSHWARILVDLGCDKIIIGASTISKVFIDHVVHTQLVEISDMIHVKMVGDTTTMNETVISMLQNETYQIAILGMADTHVLKLSPTLLESIRSDDATTVGAYLWNIRNSQVGKIGQVDISDGTIREILDKDPSCAFRYGWGAIVFKPSFERHLVKDQLHVGYSMLSVLNDHAKVPYEIMHGQYFDCGTMGGYAEYLHYLTTPQVIHIKGTIVIVAVYVNHDARNCELLCKCLTQLRVVFPCEMIVTVDNNSLNNAWHETARALNMELLINNSETHRYEMGAYRLALQHFRADEYVCIQGTMFLHTPIRASLDPHNPDATSFGRLDGLHWSVAGRELIQTLLSSIGLGDYSPEGPLVLWCCFVCNHPFMSDMLRSGMFDLISPTKNHSCAFERALGFYMNLKLGQVKCLDQSIFTKHFLAQESPCI